MNEKRLYRSNDNKMLCGVCGGIAEYLNVDPTLIRLIWAILTFAFGLSIIVYIIAAFIIPARPEGY